MLRTKTLRLLQQYYSFMTRHAVPGDLRYDYMDLCDDKTPRRLELLVRRRDMDAVCVNDTDSTPEQAGAITRLLSSFFERYLPDPSSFEKTTS